MTGKKETIKIGQQLAIISYVIPFRILVKINTSKNQLKLRKFHISTPITLVKVFDTIFPTELRFEIDIRSSKMA